MGVCASNRQNASPDTKDHLGAHADIAIASVPSNSISNKHFRTTSSQRNFAEPRFSENIWDIYEQREVLGRGSYGKVYAAVRKDNGNFFAIKKTISTEPSKAKSFLREMTVLNELDHPNIIKVQCTWRDDAHYYCVMKLCEGGSILEKVKREEFLSEKLVAEIMCDVVTALKYAHSLNIVHNDVKPDNIVFDLQTSTSPILVDWGCAMILQEGETQVQRHGTRAYSPPERGQELSPDHMKKSDMWSVGATTFVLLTGCLPFGGKTPSEMKRNICTQDYLSVPENVTMSPTALKFIMACLNRDVEQRVSPEQALEMTFLLRASAQSNENIISMMNQNLDRLASACRLQKLLLNIHVGRLSTVKKRKIKYMFEHLDKEGRGALSKQQLAQSLQEADGHVTREQALERATLLFEAAGCNEHMGLKKFARAQVANEVLTVQGMRTIFSELARVVSNSQERVEPKHFKRLFRKTFDRELTSMETEELRQSFHQSFDGKAHISEYDFLTSMGFIAPAQDSDIADGDIENIMTDSSEWTLDEIDEDSKHMEEEPPREEVSAHDLSDIRSDINNSLDLPPQITPVIFKHPSWGGSSANNSLPKLDLSRNESMESHEPASNGKQVL